MNSDFRRILDLVRKTGDRVIVTDTEGHDAYVVMDLDAYESIVLGDFEALEESFFTEHDNPESELEIESFQTEDAGEPPLEAYAPEEMVSGHEENSPPKDIWEAMVSADEKGKTWRLEDLNEAERRQLERQFAAWKRSGIEENESVLPSNPENNEIQEEKRGAPIANEDDDFGEERFYLEPVE